MKILCTFPTINISKLHFWLVICIAKNFIWTTLKAIFSIFRFYCTLRFQIFSQILSSPNNPYINGKLIDSAFRLYTNLNLEKNDHYDWFCGPGSHVITFLVLVKTWNYVFINKSFVFSFFLSFSICRHTFIVFGIRIENINPIDSINLLQNHFQKFCNWTALSIYIYMYICVFLSFFLESMTLIASLCSSCFLSTSTRFTELIHYFDTFSDFSVGRTEKLLYLYL